MSKISLDSELSQGSIQWLANRKKGIGSSDIATIMGQNPYKTCRDLWLEKTDQIEPEDLSNNFAIKRGQALEPLARNIFNETTGKNFQPVTFTHEEYEFLKASADGYDFDTNEVIEIKCMGTKNHSKVVAENKILDYYLPQVQWMLMLSKATKAYFIAYNPSYPEPIHVIEVEPDLDMHKTMTDYAFKFWHCVTTKIIPDW